MTFIWDLCFVWLEQIWMKQDQVQKQKSLSEDKNKTEN